MSTRTRILIGSAAGVAGTAALEPLRKLTQERLPQANPPMHEDPAEAVVERVEERLSPENQRRIPEQVEKKVTVALPLLYGAAAGAAYGLLRSGLGRIAADGVALGVGVWAVGYLGWLPALGIMSPVKEQRPAQVATPVVQHAAFGVVTVTVYRLLRRLFDRPPDGAQPDALERKAA